MPPRPHPFDLVFGAIAAGRFPPIAAALDAAGRPGTDRDAFLMARETVELVREVRGDDAVGEGMDELVAFVHHAFVHWQAGCRTLVVPESELAGLLDQHRPPGARVVGAPYLQLPERRAWARLTEAGPFEPLDGCFLHHADEGTLRVLGIFGLHAQRDGFTVAEVTGPAATVPVRADGSAPFAPRMAGGDAAGLVSLDDAAELLALGWGAASAPVTA